MPGYTYQRTRLPVLPCGPSPQQQASDPVGPHQTVQQHHAVPQWASTNISARVHSPQHRGPHHSYPLTRMTHTGTMPARTAPWPEQVTTGDQPREVRRTTLLLGHGTLQLHFAAEPPKAPLAHQVPSLHHLRMVRITVRHLDLGHCQLALNPTSTPPHLPS